MNYALHQIGGRFGRDHDLRYTPKGVAILTNSVAVTHVSFEKDSGQRREKTTWYSIKAFGKTAENINAYTCQGSPIFLVCSMDNEEWEDKATKEKRRRDVFKVQHFRLLESKEEQAKRQEGKGSNVRPPGQAPTHSGPPSPGPEDDEDDDIPF